MRLVWTAALLCVLYAADASAGALDRARETGELRIAYRADAQPFSYKGSDGKAAGYSVELCRAVARSAAAEVGRKELRVVEVEVTAADRLKALGDGRADLLCEATTVTFARRAEMDFSLLTFATGATLLYPKDGPTTFEQLAGKKVGVLVGSTTEAGLRQALATAGIAAEVVAVPDHTDGIERLCRARFAIGCACPTRS
jgi:ABC-type amino acid transport substrate-binding protein